MRLALVTGIILCSAVLAACAGDSVTSNPATKPGSKAPGGTTADKPSPGGADGDDTLPTKPVQLKAGAVEIEGVANGVVITATTTGDTRLIEAFLPTGGDPIKIMDGLVAADRVFVAGGAVAIYTGITSGAGTVHVWTKAAGLKDGPAASVPGMFDATADGARVAFSVEATPTATPTSTSMAVLDPATITATPPAAITGSMAINLAATTSCAPKLGFNGDRYFGAYCTGTSPTAYSGRLVTVAAGDSVGTNVVGLTNASSIKPFWNASKDNSKVLVVGLDNATVADEGRIVTMGVTPIVAKLTGDTRDGFMLDDGTAIFMTNAGELSKQVGGALPTTLVASGVKGLYRMSGDQKTVAFRTVDPSANALADLRLVDRTASSPSVVVAADGATASADFAFSQASDRLFFLDTKGDATTLQSLAVTGGTAAAVASGLDGVHFVSTSDAAVVLTDPTELTIGDKKVVTSAAQHIDLGAPSIAAGTKPAKFAAGIPAGQLFLVEKTAVYVRVSGTDAGLYAQALP